MAKAKQNKSGSKAVSGDADMDMTPMIDAVFLLMIFFVLVIDLSQKDLEDLILPEAEYARPDEEPPANRPIINVTQDGKVVYKKNTYYDPSEQGTESMAAVRSLLLQIKKDVPPKDLEQAVIAGRNVTKVNVPMLVRADKWTEWHFVGKFMTECSQPEAAFWKLELALSEEDKEENIRAQFGHN